MVSPWHAGQTVAGGRYRLGRQLGRGSFGDVYLVEQLGAAGARAVLKVLHPQWAQVPQVVERFRRESQISQRIEHPHVARVFEHGQMEGGVPFIAMEYLEGVTLREELLRGPLPPGRAYALLAAVADAVGAAHRAGIVHRDLKPENIMLVARDGRPDFPVVLDFGVAKFLDAAERLTMTGSVLGTPAYMAPEQFRGEGNLGPAADVYALGVLAFDVCSGRPPFAAKSFAELAIAHSSQQAPALSGVPKDIARVVARCLEKDPKKRPSAETVAQAFRAAAGQALSAPPPPSANQATVVLGQPAAATVLSEAAHWSKALAGRRRTARAAPFVALALLLSSGGLLLYFLLRARG